MKLKIELSIDPVALSLLSDILSGIDAIKRKLNIMSKELDNLTVQVAANTSVEQSAIVLIRGIAAQLLAAGTDPVALNALAAGLKSSADDLAVAVAENTPASPTA